MIQLDTLPQSKVKPKCSYFGTCGGCALQDLEYNTQLDLKKRQVEGALSVLNSSHSFTVRPTLPSPKPFHYRHMVAMTVKRRQGVLRLGFVGNDSRTFLAIESCPIAHEQINQFLPEALRKLEGLPPERKFNTSQVVLRVGDNGEVVTSLRPDRGRKLECKVGAKHFSYSISSFFQNNFSILESFIETVRRFLCLNPPPLSSPRNAGGGREGGRGALFDLYSGVGLFGISLADSYRRVIGIEEGYEAVQLAIANAKQNEIGNISFLEGKVEHILPQLIKDVRVGQPRPLMGEETLPLHAVVDPPRIGLKPEVIQCLLKLPIDKLVYVSCELAPLRRDLELLQEGFKVTQVQPIDLFPQTKHIETVVLLEPKLR